MRSILVSICLLFFPVMGFAQEAANYIEAAKKGDYVAQFNLGYCYNMGLGVPQDNKQAIYWYKKSAMQGYADAQFNLGNCYYLGEGTEVNYIQAVYWYKLASAQKQNKAQYNLALCYMDGTGVKRDDA